MSDNLIDRLSPNPIAIPTQPLTAFSTLTKSKRDRQFHQKAIMIESLRDKN